MSKAPWFGSKWFRVKHPETGVLWCESSDEREVRKAAQQVGGQVEQLWQKVTTKSKWRKI